MPHATGWLPDPPDERDLHLKAIRGPLTNRARKVTGQAELPSKAELYSIMSPVRDQGPIGSCHDDQTEVLTDRGWVLFSELDGGERLATVDPKTSELTYEAPTRLVRFSYDGEMVCGQSQSIDFKVTPDHKMLVRRWDERARTLSNDYTLLPAGELGWYSGLLNRVTWCGEGASETYTLRGVPNRTRADQRAVMDLPMNVWLKFLGLYLAEGTMLKRTQRRGCLSYKIQIAASKEREKKYARDLLAQLGVTALELADRFTFQNRRVYESLADLGLEGIGAGEKFVPRFVFRQSKDSVEAFLEGHFMGDGSMQNEHRAHYTSSERLANDLQTLAFLSGNESLISVRAARSSMTGDGRAIVGSLPEHRVSVCERKNLSIDRAEQITREHYSGEVFCAEVPTHHTLVTRRNGKILISGNCTAFAVGVGLAESIEIEHLRDPFFPLSPLFLYYATRLRSRQSKQDSGATLRATMKTMAKVGICPENLWPYTDVEERFTQRPSKQAFGDTERFRFRKYYRVANLDDLKLAIASKNPVVGGFMLYPAFESAKVAKTGIVPMPGKREQSIGGHAMSVFGYDDNGGPDGRGHVVMKNSWGTDWGDRGMCFLPYDYFDTDAGLAVDLWTASL